MGQLNDWKCHKCNIVREEYVRKEDDPPSCPKCGSLMQKIITANYRIQINEPHRMSKDRMK